MQFSQLISTSNEDKLNNCKTVYLGNWCKTDSYIIQDFPVVPYHWDDRVKLENDNNYLNLFYEKILIILSKKLNNLHQKKHNKEYWRLVLGYWLFYYLSVDLMEM